jgi:hypothetical protein
VQEHECRSTSAGARVQEHECGEHECSRAETQPVCEHRKEGSGNANRTGVKKRERERDHGWAAQHRVREGKPEKRRGAA